MDRGPRERVFAFVPHDDRLIGERVEPAPVLLAEGRDLVVVDAALDERVLDACQRGVQRVEVGGAGDLAGEARRQQRGQLRSG